MRKSYLAAGPRFANLTMVPKPLELNVIGEGAAQWWETMDRRPIVRRMFASLHAQNDYDEVRRTKAIYHLSWCFCAFLSGF